MPLYIRDDGVAALAEQVRKALGAATKTEAVKTALLRELEHARAKPSLGERLAPAIALARSIGPKDPAFDMKAFTDEMWDEH